MADDRQKLQATVSAAVKSRQTGLDPFLVQRVGLLFRPTDVQRWWRGV